MDHREQFLYVRLYGTFDSMGEAMIIDHEGTVIRAWPKPDRVDEIIYAEVCPIIVREARIGWASRIIPISSGTADMLR